MNIQQLEYIVAVNRYRHFVQASEHCHVTQPTLSMMIRKLEEELGVKIFDRTKQPIIPTEIGLKVIDQAHTILRETAKLAELTKQYNGILSGELRVGVIPTVAPYLLPQFIQPFITHYPDIQLQISDMITEKILLELKRGTLDAGIVATSSDEHSFKGTPLYQEKLLVYVSDQGSLYDKKFILPDEIDPNELWLLEEGHCFRSQIQKLCELSRASTGHSLNYRAGSIETLIRMVDRSGGLTIIPELALHDFSPKRLKNVREFMAPAPVREISIIYNREQVKTRMIEVLENEILAHIPEGMKRSSTDVLVL